MENVVVAYKKGYRITESGIVLNSDGKVVEGYINSGGYKCFRLRLSIKRGTNLGFHRLQAFQKYGESMFEKGILVRHKNNIQLDNSYENILIGTHSENMMDIPEAIRSSKSIYASSFVTKHNHSEIKKFHTENGNSYKKTMNHFNISSKGTLNFILNK